MLTNETGEDLARRGRGRPRDEEARRRILESALDLIEDVGFANATTEAIAERAGASKATIYRWWPNKAAVLIEALREQVAQELPFPNTGNLREDIHQQLLNFIQLVTSRRGRVFKAFVAVAQNDPDFAQAFLTVWIQPRRAEAAAILEHHQASGALRRDIEIGNLLDMIYGPIYLRLLAGHSPLTLEFAEEITDIVLPGVQNTFADPVS